MTNTPTPPPPPPIVLPEEIDIIETIDETLKKAYFFFEDLKNLQNLLNKIKNCRQMLEARASGVFNSDADFLEILKAIVRFSPHNREIVLKIIALQEQLEEIEQQLSFEKQNLNDLVSTAINQMKLSEEHPGDYFINRTIIDNDNTSPPNSILSEDLYQDYLSYCETKNIRPLALNILSQRLTKLGIKRKYHYGKTAYIGIKFKEDHEMPEVEKFIRERTYVYKGSSISALALYDNYVQWCEVNKYEPVGLPVFSRQLGDLGLCKAKISDKIHYIDIKFIPTIA